MGRPKDEYYWNRVTKEKNGELKCKQCGHQFKGGVSRIKAHVDGIAKQGIAICPVVTEGVHKDIPSSSNIPQEATNAMDSFKVTGGALEMIDVNIGSSINHQNNTGFTDSLGGEMAQKLNCNELSKDLGKKKRLADGVADPISIDSPSESSDEESTSSSFQRRKRVRVEGRPIVISSGSLVSVAQYVADSIKSNEYVMEKMAVELRRTKAKLAEEKKAHKRTRSAAKEKVEQLMEQCAGKEMLNMKVELELKMELEQVKLKLLKADHEMTKVKQGMTRITLVEDDHLEELYEAYLSLVEDEDNYLGELYRNICPYY